MDKNLVILVGRLGDNATFGNMSNNGYVPVRMSLATTARRSNGDKTTWHTVLYWAKGQTQIDFLTSALSKGTEVMVTGELDSIKSQHSEYPVMMNYVTVVASDLQVGRVAQSRTMGSPGYDGSVPANDNSSEYGDEEARTSFDDRSSGYSREARDNSSHRQVHSDTRPSRGGSSVPAEPRHNRSRAPLDHERHDREVVRPQGRQQPQHDNRPLRCQPVSQHEQRDLGYLEHAEQEQPRPVPRAESSTGVMPRPTNTNAIHADHRMEF